MRSISRATFPARSTTALVSRIAPKGKPHNLIYYQTP